MYKNNITALLCCLLVMAPCLTFADFSINYGAMGMPNLIEGKSVGLLVTDSESDGFLGFGDNDRRDADIRLVPLNPGAKVGDDQVIAVMTATTIDGHVGFDSGIVNVKSDEAPWAGAIVANAPMALLVLYDGDLLEGSRFGLYRSDSITDAGYGANHAYQVPTAGVDATVLSVATGISLFGGPPGQVTSNAFANSDKTTPAPLFGVSTESLSFVLASENLPLILEIATPQPGLYVMEISQDLTHWHLLTEHTVTTENVWVVEDSRAISAERSFYRWWRYPDSP